MFKYKRVSKIKKVISLFGWEKWLCKDTHIFDHPQEGLSFSGGLGRLN